MGVLSQEDIDCGDNHYGDMDGDDADEGLLFTFDSPVELASLDLGSVNGNDDFNLTIDNITHLKDFDSNETSPLVYKVVDKDKFYFSGLVGTDFLIWTDGSSDDYRVDSLTISTIPEPMVITLIASFGGGMLMMRRYL